MTEQNNLEEKEKSCTVCNKSFSKSDKIVQLKVKGAGVMGTKSAHKSCAEFLLWNKIMNCGVEGIWIPPKEE